jgi:hypothetical protein
MFAWMRKWHNGPFMIMNKLKCFLGVMAVAILLSPIKKNAALCSVKELAPLHVRVHPAWLLACVQSIGSMPCIIMMLFPLCDVSYR